MLSALLGIKTFDRGVAVTNENTINDPLRYPYMLDPFRFGRENPKYNEAVLPFCQNTEFLGTNMMPYMMRRPYLTKYRDWKTKLTIDTATDWKLDDNLVSYWNNFRGDYNTPFEDMISTMAEGNSKLPVKKRKKCYTNFPRERGSNY